MRKLQMIIISMLLLFPIHLYLTGSLMAAWKIADETSWKVDGNASSPVKVKMQEWKTWYIQKPFSVIGKVITPSGDFEKNVSKRTWFATPVVYILCYWLVFKGVWRSRHYRDASDYGSHGTSRWAKRSEIFRKGENSGFPVNEVDGAGVLLGYDMKGFKKKYITVPPDSEFNQNVVVYGGSGIGKSFTWVKPQIYHAIYSFKPQEPKRLQSLKRRLIPTEYSLFVVDPKGENYRDTADKLSESGYKVHIFNLVNIDKSDRWNPMDYVRSDLDAEKLANTIIMNSNGGHTNGDPFWPKAEKALMSAIILFVKYELPEDQQNLSNVLQLGITVGREEEVMTTLFETLPFNHPALMKYNIFRIAEDKTRSGILIGFATHLELFANRQISELTSQSDFVIGDIGKEKTALFLVIPDADKTFKSLTSLLISQCFQEWWRVASLHNDTLPVGVRMILDEFANIGVIPDFAERISVMRSKGVSAQIILQTMSQLNKLYEKDWKVIVAACDTTVFLGTNDKDTAKEISEALGDKTIAVQSSSQKVGQIGGDPSQSEQYQARRLMTEAEVRRHLRRENVILQNGSYPFKTLKSPFIKHPLAKDYVSTNPNDHKPVKHRGFSLFNFEEYMSGILAAAAMNDSDDGDVEKLLLQDSSSDDIEQVLNKISVGAVGTNESSGSEQKAPGMVEDSTQIETEIKLEIEQKNIVNSLMDIGFSGSDVEVVESENTDKKHHDLAYIEPSDSLQNQSKENDASSEKERDIINEHPEESITETSDAGSRSASQEVKEPVNLDSSKTALDDIKI
jgi:type IV secretion system protein VirD4